MLCIQVPEIKPPKQTQEHKQTELQNLDVYLSMYV